ncbi:hypothetical protein ACHHYP_04597 [Achlya hypogyna]|uniref:KIF-binding protein n=1 Tax=Achlya hypogyna TaxID=1202772 RepID=A0A1V9Z0R8_ACHHY|nr:hypothetical protein ACHHYP_04597 [Achlya hypogyna]
MKDALAEAKRLVAAEAPAATPYVHLYAARELLQSATPATPQEQLQCWGLLGQICLAVDEPHAAQPYLEKALAVLPASGPLQRYAAALSPDAPGLDALPPPAQLVPANLNVEVADVVALLQQLGLLWSGRGQHARALAFLATAEALGCDEGPVHTHTLFFLAQVHGHLGDAAASARYCQLTLRRQLEAAGPLDDGLPGDWVANCLGLAAFYTTTRQLAQALECVTACKHMDLAAEPAARVALVEAKTWLELLAAAPVVAAGPAALFPSLPPPPPLAPVVDFDTARAVFKRAMASLETAKGVFVLDGHVTDHIRVLQLQSQAFARLAAFEPDRKRQMAMLQRRLGFLTPLLFHADGTDAAELNRNAFGYLVQELLFEAGDVFAALHDLKAQHPSKAYATTNHFGTDGIRCYERFLKLYYFQQGTDARSELEVALPRPPTRPSHLADADARPFFLGLFYLARLHGKLQFLDAKATVAAWSESTRHAHTHAEVDGVRSLRLHEAFVALTAAAPECAAERAIALEMTRLLPEKIHRAHYQQQFLT